MALIPACTTLAKSWILEKGFLNKGWFDFWKEPVIARSQVKWVWSPWKLNQIDTNVIKVHVCYVSFVRSCIVMMQLDLRLTLSLYVPMTEYTVWRTFGKTEVVEYVAVIVALSGFYVDNNNRPLSIEENGEHSLSWTETCFQYHLAWFIFGQPHHFRTFIFHSEEGNSTLVTYNNIRKPLDRVICFKFLQLIALPSFSSVVNWWGNHPRHLMDQASCSWTIACALQYSLQQAPRQRIWVL